MKGTGAVVVLVAGGGVWRAYDRGVFSSHTGPAYEPWDTWRTDDGKGPMALVRAAILAANAANCQPWLFRVSDSTIELYVDQRRNLGAFDPYLRELHISVGCALENLMLTAAANGYLASLTLLPGSLGAIPERPRPELVARVALTHGPQVRADLYDAIPRRHTNRTPFDVRRPLPSAFVDELLQRTNDDPEGRMFVFTDDADRTRIVRQIAAAGGVIASHPEIQAMLGRTFHTDWHELQKQRDGLTFGDFGESSRQTAMEKFFPPSILRAISPRPTLAAYADILSMGRLFGLIAVRDRYERSANLRAGRLWQRAHLLATARGLAARPANQSVELIDHERVWGHEPREAAALAAITSDASWQPTFMFFMGYAIRDAPRTARRDVRDVVVGHNA